MTYFNDFSASTTKTVFDITFEYLDASHIHVYGGYNSTTKEYETEITTGFTVNGAQVTFASAPNQALRIIRETPVDPAQAEYYPSVAIRAEDLNNNQDQALYSIEEARGSISDIEADIDDINSDIDSINDQITQLVGVELLADVTALNAYTPTNVSDAIVVLNSTNWSTANDVTGTPAGFTGGTNLRVNLRVTAISPKSYAFINYSAADPDERYVKVDGDNMTDNLTFNTDKIVLNATDGTATFAGAGNFGNRVAVTSEGFAFVAKVTGNAANRGALMNTGELRIGPDVTNTASCNTRLMADGSATFAGNVKALRHWAKDGDIATYLGNTNDYNGDEYEFLVIDESGTPISEKRALAGIKADGSATFASSQIGLYSDGSASFYKKETGQEDLIALYSDAPPGKVIRFSCDGSAEFAGNVFSKAAIASTRFGYTSQLASEETIQGTTRKYAFVAKDDNSTYKAALDYSGNLALGNDAWRTPNIYLQGDNGSATFADIVKGGAFHITDSKFTADSDELIRILKGGDRKFVVTQTGSAAFAGSIDCTGSRIQVGGNPIGGAAPGTAVPNNGAVTIARASGADVWLGFTVGNGTATSMIDSNGSATFAGNITAPNMTFNLEPDNDANYTTTTDAEGNETRVYNGPTLDVKAVIQELQQRVADRDAVITNLTTRLTALEAAINPAPTPQPTPEPTPEPTPTPTNLIPDEWTHIEKLKALKELIAEMDL